MTSSVLQISGNEKAPEFKKGLANLIRESKIDLERSGKWFPVH
jgi:hypothetical protein